MDRRSATAWLVAATAAVSLFFLFSAWHDWAFGGASFISARASGAVVLSDAVPVWLTPLSATLVHAGLLHLGLNMMVLWVVGRDTERLVGPAYLLLIYGVAAYASALGQWLAYPMSPQPVVGASGAISGIIGAYSLLTGQRRARAIGPIPATLVQVVWLGLAWALVNYAIQLVSAGSGFPIAGVMHIGGFVAGVLMAWPVLGRVRAAAASLR